jgi:thiol-disulfide isomerase/thioredoxin
MDGSGKTWGHGETTAKDDYSSDVQEAQGSQDSLDASSSQSAAAPVTHVDLVRASQIADLAERIQLLETYLNRPVRPELQRLVFRMLVSSCRQSGDYDGAIFYGEEALGEFPYDGPVLLEVTSAFAEMEESDLDKGIAYAERAKAALDAAATAMGEGGEGRIGIFVGLCWSDWGWLLFRKGETAEAERLLGLAVDRKKDPKIYNRLAQVQAAGGKLEEAKDAYAMALALSSGKDMAAMEGLQEIVSKQGGGETDVDAVIREKRQEIAERKKDNMREQTKIEPKAAPAFDVTTLAGETLSLKDLKGSVVTLDFWATWCGPCRKELPVIQKISEQFRDENVVFLAASVDADTSKVRPYVKKSELSLPVAFAQSVGRAYGASSIPTLFLIDAAGMIRYVHVGYHPDLEEVLPLQIRELLQEL